MIENLKAPGPEPTGRELFSKGKGKNWWGTPKTLKGRRVYSQREGKRRGRQNDFNSCKWGKGKQGSAR